MARSTGTHNRDAALASNPPDDFGEERYRPEPVQQVAPAPPPTTEPPPVTKKQRLQISIPLSVEATASVRSKAAVYRGQVTQEAFVAMIAEELGVEKRLPEVLRAIIDRLERERRVALGLEAAVVEHEEEA